MQKQVQPLLELKILSLSNGLHRSDTRCLQYLKKLTKAKVTNTHNYLISSNKNSSDSGLTIIRKLSRSLIKLLFNPHSAL